MAKKPSNLCVTMCNNVYVYFGKICLTLHKVAVAPPPYYTVKLWAKFAHSTTVQTWAKFAHTRSAKFAHDMLTNFSKSEQKYTGKGLQNESTYYSNTF